MKTVPSTPTGTHTVSSVLAFLESQLESNGPDAVLAVLVERNGKPLTKRLLAKLPGGEERWLINDHAGMTHLVERGYLRSNGNRGMSLLMAYDVKNITIDSTWVEEHNPAYFKGRRERNAERNFALRNPSMAALMAERLNAYADAKVKLDEAKAALDEHIDHVFSADRYEWERMCGAREERS
jgi:hypothetical protein